MVRVRVRVRVRVSAGYAAVIKTNSPDRLRVIVTSNSYE